MIRIEKKEKHNDVKEAAKILIILLLSYLVPVVGAGFSLYILSNKKMKNYARWVPVLSVISLIIQLLIILLMLIGYLMWFGNA